MADIIENTDITKNENVITEPYTDADGDSQVASVTENISKVRLTLEEIIANDNELSRKQYINVDDDVSSVSSTLESDRGSIFSAASIRSNASSSMGNNDAFRGVDDEEFSNLDRYGFLKTLSEKEFMEKERLRL